MYRTKWSKAEIASRLKQQRKSVGLTQTQVAIALGSKQQTVASWESGQSQPDADTLFRLCELYGTTVDEMFGYSTQRDGAEKYGRMPKTTDERVERFVHEIMSTEPENFKRRLLITLSQLNETEWLTLERIIGRLESNNEDDVPLQWAAASGDTSNLEEAQKRFEEAVDE